MIAVGMGGRTGTAEGGFTGGRVAQEEENSTVAARAAVRRRTTGDIAVGFIYIRSEIQAKR